MSRRSMVVRGLVVVFVGVDCLVTGVWLGFWGLRSCWVVGVGLFWRIRGLRAVGGAF